MTAVLTPSGTPPGLSAVAPASRPPVGRSPAWPTVALLGWYPLFWLLGFGAFVWILFPATSALSLVLRRRLLVPPGFLLWLGFLGFMVLSAVQLEEREDLLTFGLRAGFYLGATVLVLDIVNGGGRLGAERVHRVLVVFFMAAVVGGLLGLLVPRLSVPSIAAALLPEGIAGHPFVADLITPTFAEVQVVRGVELVRPSAPFTYTNGWGAAMALLAPFAVAAAVRPVRGMPVALVRGFLALSLVPILLSLNRGLWFGLALAAAYTAARRRPSGRAGLGVGMIVVVLVVGAVITWTPLGEQALSSLSVRAGDSDNVRTQLIEETIDRVGESPVLGYGGPRPSGFAAVPLGTHGQLWTVLFSHGIPATLLYMGFFVHAIWWSRNPRTPLGVAAHVTLVVGLTQTIYYGQLPHQLFILMAAFALAVRDREPASAGSVGPVDVTSAPMATTAPAG